METELLISVIVPVYNVESRLDRCIESLVNQTYRNLQIILVDDGSRDRSGTICDEWAAKDQRVTVIHKQNGGVGKARNTGLDAACGSYVAFVDSDDYIAPDMYERMTASVLKNQSDQVCCCLYNDYPTGRQAEKHAFGLQTICGDLVYSELILSMVTPDQASKKARLLQSPCNKLYRRDILEQNHIRFDPELPYAEDWVFNLNFYRFARCVSFIPEHLYFYDRTTEGSLSKKFRRNGFDHSFKIRTYEKEWFPQLHTEESFRDLILHIQSHYLNQYARTFGYSGFGEYARFLFGNENLRNLYIRSATVPGTYKLPHYCFRNHQSSVCSCLYQCWAAIHVCISAAKHYVKKLL